MILICTDFFFKNGDFYVKLVSSKVSNPFCKNLFETSYTFLRDEAFTINNDTTILTLPIWNSSLIKNAGMIRVFALLAIWSLVMARSILSTLLFRSFKCLPTLWSITALLIP